MPTSGSTDYTLTARQVIEEALHEIKVVGLGQSMAAEDAARALAVLSRMLKSWQMTGPNLWRWSTQSIAPVASQAAYTASPRALIVKNVRWRSAGRDLPLSELNQNEYDDLPTKTQSGRPVSWYFDRQRDASTLYMWPVPMASHVTAGDTIEVRYQRVIEDVDDLSNALDLPQEHLDVVAMSLAERLAGTFGAQDDLTRLRAHAGELRAAANGFDRTGSVFFGTDRR